jgi:hypothetical protein
MPFAVFQRLANDKFCERNRCIVITVTPNLASSVYSGMISRVTFILFDAIVLSAQGRGYPDIPTRRHVLFLIFFCLVYYYWIAI